MKPQHIEMAREVIRVAVAICGRGAARVAWRRVRIHISRLERIEEAAAKGWHLVEASAAREDDPMRRLRKQPNGIYQMRITPTTDPKKTGRQRTYSLKTTNLEEAQQRRDIVEMVLDDCGLLRAGAKSGIKKSRRVVLN